MRKQDVEIPAVDSLLDSRVDELARATAPPVDKAKGMNE
jgi:hypothetical protein